MFRDTVFEESSFTQIVDTLRQLMSCCCAMQGQQTESVAAAVQMLVQQNLSSGVRPVALISPNTFRTDRLYTEEVDLLYKKHLPLLKAIYSAFRRAPAGGGLRLKVSFASCLSECIDL